MTGDPTQPRWSNVAVLIGRLIFRRGLRHGVSFKLYDIGGTATYIAAAGLPMATLLAWLAVALELGLVVCLATGAYFSEAALVATAYVLFLGFAFHGPSHWSGNQSEFGFFVDHFTFAAGLLFAAAHGPGNVLAVRLGRIRPAG